MSAIVDCTWSRRPMKSASIFVSAAVTSISSVRPPLVTTRTLPPSPLTKLPALEPVGATLAGLVAGAAVSPLP